MGGSEVVEITSTLSPALISSPAPDERTRSEYALRSAGMRDASVDLPLPESEESVKGSPLPMKRSALEPGISERFLMVPGTT